MDPREDFTGPGSRITDRKLNESVNSFGESGSGGLIFLPLSLSVAVLSGYKHLQLAPAPCGSHNISPPTVAAVLLLKLNTVLLLLEHIGV